MSESHKKIEVIAVFDIGRTNKKFFLFDEEFKEVHREYKIFKQIKDEDNYPTEDLASVTKWMKMTFAKILKNDTFDIKSINFSGYGASIVHLDNNGELVSPLYNYTKPLSKVLTDKFYTSYGPKLEFLRKTGSADSGMLNTGFQLYWLKYQKPKVFSKIKYSLHLPQYLSYIFTGIPYNGYSSVGCHTGLWDYDAMNYHHWVYQEGIDKILAPLTKAETSIPVNFGGKLINVGVGVHDSSSALSTYTKINKEPFILVSTGTWSISLNPYTDQQLTKTDIIKNCTNYMSLNGKPVKASRLFLGNEYKIQVSKLTKLYNVSKDTYKSVKFNSDIYDEIIEDYVPLFKWDSLPNEDCPKQTQLPYDNFSHAYHHLMVELVQLQVDSIKEVIGIDTISTIYVDGGFTDNDIYIKLVSNYFKNCKLMTAYSSLGSALGAAIAVSNAKLDFEFINKNYDLKNHIPLVQNTL